MINSPSTTNIVESLMVKVGSCGRYQYRMFAVFLCKWVVAAMFLMSPNFLFLTTDFTCLDGENGKQTCEEWVCSHSDPEFWRKHLPDVPRSLSYDFELLVCSREWVASLVLSLMYWGSFAGYVGFPFVADNFGRKRAEQLSWLMACVGAVVLACSFNIPMAGVGLFLCGLGTNSAITLHYTFIKEFVVGAPRDIMIISLQITFSAGVCLIALVGLLLPNWRLISIFFFAVPMLILLVTGRKWVEETPEFSIQKGHDVLLASLNRIARLNGRSELQPQQIEETLKDYSRDSQKLTIFSMFQFRSLRLISYCCGITNMALEFIYDGTLFNLNRIGLNLYTNQMVIGAAEMLASIYANLIVEKFKRKRYTIINLLLLAALLTLLAFTGGNDEGDQGSGTTGLELAVLILMRFVLSSLWGFYFVYLSELYPCEITSISYGYMSAVGAAAASVSPYVRLATKSDSMLLMAGLSAVAAGHVGCLPETKGSPTKLRVKEREQVTEKQEKMSLISEGSSSER